jgi:hypothetical protein
VSCENPSMVGIGLLLGQLSSSLDGNSDAAGVLVPPVVSQFASQAAQ